MKDPHLEAMLSGERSPQNTRFDLALKEYLDSLTFEPSDLLSSQAKREKLEKELKESFTHSELKHHLSKAAQIVKDKTFPDLFNTAVSKFKEERYEESLSLFVLLTVLHPKEYDLWYRLGIAAGACENYSLSLKSYAIAKELNPNLIESYLFSVECYLKLGKKQEAESELAIAEKLLEVNPSFKELFLYAKNLLQ